MQAVLIESLETVLDRHLERAAPADLALWMLRGLEVLDPSLRPEVTSASLLLYAPDRLLAARPLPPAGAPGQARGDAAGPLGAGLGALFEAAWRHSPLLRQAGTEAMLRAAFEELFDHLDPYSRYLTPEEAAEARRRRLGEAALGLRLVAGSRGAVMVAEVVAGGPAAQAGLRVGDRLLAIDGMIPGRDALTATALLEGPEGTEVALLLGRGRRRLTVVLQRTVIAPRTVQGEVRDGIVWLRIEAFSSATDRQLEQALASGLAGASSIRGVVLDLRGNRGGLLSQAAAVAGAFLDGGPVVRTAGRAPEADRLYSASGPDRAGGLPLVVLIDGRSASAAEVVAAALGDRRRAAVIGSATLGKGLIQVVLPLSNGGELLVSWARLTAPLGWPIQGLGVLPALCTAFGPEATAAALARLARRDPPMGPVLARLRAARAPVAGSEVAALRASCPPAEGRDGDLLAARLLFEQQDALSTALGR